MKTKLLYICLAGAVILPSISSCTELENTSYNSIVADGFAPTDEDVASLLASGYVSWRKTMLLWNGVVRAEMLGADQDMIPARPNGWVDGGVYKRMHQHKWTSEDDIPLQSWVRTYDGINTCNRVLYQIESGQIKLGDREKTIVSELKVLRASYYYLLDDLFGNVPIVTKFDVPDGYLPEQNSRQEVYEFIIRELTENIPNLSESVSSEYYGRFNKWAAYTLLAKMYLNSEVFSNNTHKDYDKCIEACDQVINSGKYELESTRKNVFATKNENSKEIIFALPFDETYVDDWNAFDFHMYSLQPENQATYNFQATPWGGACVIPQYIDTFDPDDKRLTDDFISGMQFSANGDTLRCTMGNLVGRPLNYVNHVTSIDASEENQGLRWGKFEYAEGITNRLSNDFPLLRYADVLLMKAEALLRTNHADEAAKLVTMVRERNFASNPTKATVTGSDLMGNTCYDYGRRDNILTTHDNANVKYGRMLDELGWEFSQEGRRRQDMVRFGVFTTRAWFSHDASDASRNLFPIPNKELLSNGNLKQNPGY
ncbi:RagB/SusD family nutrient uptake outer membrane protein [Hallella bergensis]|uniref:RagB/SusD family nutrient uptake outer membrane protein n=1 Tax=Hallella bergensis TaxID=242750 RepID=UPI003990A634